jgi:hypothetical protein
MISACLLHNFVMQSQTLRNLERHMHIADNYAYIHFPKKSQIIFPLTFVRKQTLFEFKFLAINLSAPDIRGTVAGQMRLRGQGSRARRPGGREWGREWGMGGLYSAW